MVNVNETTCLVEAVGGGVFAGTDGGGIARWTEDGVLTSVQTTVETELQSNDIVDLARGIDSCFAITGTTRPFVYATGSSGDGWFSPGQVSGATGPLRSLRGTDERFVVLDNRGAVFVSDDGIEWESPQLPDGTPIDGWEQADRDGDMIALVNGTEVLVLDLNTDENLTITAPIVDGLDLAENMLAVASVSSPDVYDLDNWTWLDNRITNAMAKEGDDWSLVTIDGGRLTATTREGVVMRVDLTPPVSTIDVTVLGSLPVDLDANVTDMLLMTNDTVLLSTRRGNWIIEGGEAMPFMTSDLSMPPSNDILSVSFEADALWTLTPYGMAVLNYDSRGHPTSWAEGPEAIDGWSLGMLDTALLEGRVYISGLGPGIQTYDTFASSATSRWGRVHVYGDARDQVNDVLSVNGTLYTCGPYGLDRMMTGSDPPSFEMVTGSPSGVLSMFLVTPSLIYIGTEDGLSSYNLATGLWDEEGDIIPGLITGPVSDMSRGGYTLKFSIDDAITEAVVGGREGKVLIEGSAIVRLSNRPDVGDPLWAVAGGRAFTVMDLDIPIGEPEREDLGNAWIHDVAVASDGIAYLATDSGLHRIDRFATQWTDWTTSDGLSANDIRTLAKVPGTDDLWIGAYGGVDKLDVNTESMERIGTEDGLPSNLVYDIETDGNNIWIGTDEGGAARADLDDLVWQTFNQSTGLIADDVQVVAVRASHVLFGTDEGVTVLDRSNSTIDSYTATSSDLPGNWVWCALSTEEGIYVGTDSGLALFMPDQGGWKAISSEELDDVAVRSLYMDMAGFLWVGTNAGLHRITLDNDHDVRSSETLDRTSGLPGDEVLALRRTSDNSMWAGTSAGVAIIDSGFGVQAFYTTEDGLVHDRVTAIAEGPEDTIWLGTAGGLSRVTKQWWDLLPQSTSPLVDVPDVYISLDNLVVEPEEPNEGDLVNISVTVSNPSGKRAIVHVGLFEDEGGTHGEEVSSSIAYTEPGGTYKVTLEWTAEGGERSLWVVADPDDVVPESNERNNVVALSVHVNHNPEILYLYLGPPQGAGPYPEQMAQFSFSFTYRDLDGEWATQATAQVDGTSKIQHLQLQGGDTREGIPFTGFVLAPLGEFTIVFKVTDGRSWANASTTAKANFAIDVNGLERGRDEDGDVRFTLDILDPWEGDALQFVEVWFVEPGTDPMDMDVWSGNTFKSATGEGEGWVFDASRVEPGEYDVWVLATDNRWIMALHVEEGIVVEEISTEQEVPQYLWMFGFAIIVALVAVIVYAMFRRF
jgi:ligand-binding sensor domain-containing protein